MKPKNNKLFFMLKRKFSKRFTPIYIVQEYKYIMFKYFYNKE